AASRPTSSPARVFRSINNYPSLDLERDALFGRRGRAENLARARFDGGDFVVASARLVVKEPEVAWPAFRREPRHFLPARVAPAFVMSQFLRREMRIGDQRAGVGAERREPLVQITIAKLVISQIHQIASRPANPIAKGA